MEVEEFVEAGGVCRGRRKHNKDTTREVRQISKLGGLYKS